MDFATLYQFNEWQFFAARAGLLTIAMLLSNTLRAAELQDPRQRPPGQVPS